MRRLAYLAIAALALFAATPALAGSQLLNVTITTAVTGVVSTPLDAVEGGPLNLVIQCNFTYGSGGTSADAYVQTSVDGGTTWTDIAECGFTTGAKSQDGTLPKPKLADLGVSKKLSSESQRVAGSVMQ